MNRYNELKLQVLALFASTQGEWLGPNEAAGRLDFFPARSAWTYFKRLWSFGLLERRSRGRGTFANRSESRPACCNFSRKAIAHRLVFATSGLTTYWVRTSAAPFWLEKRQCFCSLRSFKTFAMR